MNRRNFIYNQHGGVDCEIEVGRIDEVLPQDAVLDEDGNILQPAQIHIPAVEGEWLPHTLEHIPEDVEIAPYIAPDKTKAQLIDAVAARRYDVETAGITLMGKQISTTRESQTMLAAAIQSLSLGLIEYTNWKDGNEWVQVDLTTLTPIARAVANHVSNCFTAEMQHCQAINQLTEQSDIDTYDINQGWPV